MPKIRLDDFELYYETHGSGPPLVLVTGLGGFADYWKPQLDMFSRHFTVVTHDHRGCGASTHSRIDYSVDQMTGDLLKLMDALKIERAHVVGHSTGGAIAQAIAIDHPDRVANLVLYATWTKADPFMRRVFEPRKALLAAAGAEPYVRGTAALVYPDWWINANAEALAEADKRTLARFSTPEIVCSRIDGILAFDRSAELKRIAAPTLVICAEDDYLTPSYFSKEIAVLIPGARLHLMERGGHVCSQTMPEEFNGIVLPFLTARP
jgi:aminoacrylate hydrolase